MMTPPLSISAMPRFTLAVPVSGFPATERTVAPISLDTSKPPGRAYSMLARRDDPPDPPSAFGGIVLVETHRLTLRRPGSRPFRRTLAGGRCPTGGRSGPAGGGGRR